MSKFILIGSGDHSSVIQEELMAKKSFYGFVDTNKKKNETQFKKILSR